MTRKDFIHAEQIVNQCIENAIRINAEYPRRLEEKLTEISRSIISEWYASYDPNMYHRHGNMIDFVQISFKGSNYSIMFNPDAMRDTHRAPNDVIFWNSFVRGYHGGAPKGKDHPSIGTPYWRDYGSDYMLWGEPAVKTFSPYERMYDEFNTCIEQYHKSLKRVFNKDVMNPIKRAMQALNRK